MSKITPKQRDSVDRQKAHGESLRSWLQDRAAALTKARAARREAAAKSAATTSRGVDRVPARFRGPNKPTPVHLVEHAADNYATRRARGQFHGSGMRSGSNQPYVNPARDAKPGARLRKELR